MKKFSQILDSLRSISPYSRSGERYGIKSRVRPGRTRGLRLEQLEDRTLLSINGLGNDQDLSTLFDVTGADPIMATQVLSESDVISLQYELPDLLMQTVEETTTGTIISEAVMPGAYQSVQEGNVALPLVPVEIVVPYGSEVDTIEVVADGNVTLLDSYVLEEATTPVIIDPIDQTNNGGEQDMLENEATESEMASGLYEVIGTQWRRGVETILVNLKPVQYISETGTVSYYTSITLNVNLTEGDAMELADGQTIRYRPDDIRSLEQDVANPEALSTYVESDAASSLSALGICDPLDSYQYVVITNQTMVDSTADFTVNDLVAYKQAHGMSATVVTVENIYANYSGVDQQEQIRNFVTDAYNNWNTDFVLLGGDTNVIPYRSLYVPISDLNSSERSVPSDLYYQCLDGNFNNDGDSYWGEANDGIGGGDVDLLAEVYVGRVSAENTSEMANWVYKNMAYEDSASDPYRTDAVIVGEHLGFGGISEYATASMEEIRLGTSVHGYTTAGFASDPAFTTSTLYDSSSYTWNSSTLINLFNSNSHGIYNHLGHANTSSVMKLNNSSVDSSLTNDKFFFAYSQGCYPGEFPGNAIAEHFTTSTRNGAAAVIFNSRYGWGMGNSTDGPSQRPNREFWDALFSEELNQLGTMNADSHEDILWDISDLYTRFVTYETNLFGDPAAKIVSLDMTVTGCTPATGSTVSTPPTDFTITFSEPYSASSVDAGDLVVNGVVADSFTLTDAQTIMFHYTTSPVTMQGLQGMEIGAGSILRATDDGPVLAWNSSFRYDAQVVSVVATNPLNHAVTTIPFDTLQIDFDEPIDAGSIGVDDLTLSQGSVVSASMVDADTVEYTLTGINTEGTMNFSLTAGAVLDAWGNPGAAYSGDFTLDIETVPFPTPLTASTPLGGLIYTGTASGTIAPGSDTDSFTIDLDAGQTLTALVQPETGLQAIMIITDPGGVALGTTVAPDTYSPVILQALPVATAGTYTIAVGSVGGAASADFTLELTLNAALEEETYGVVTNNDSMPTAQDITDSFVQLGDSLAQRGAVVGSFLPSATADAVVDSEDFESGLGAQWSTYSSNSYGRIQVTNSYGAADGSHALIMDSKTDGHYVLNEAIWTVELSGAYSPTLSFYSKEWSDEDNNFSGDFTGHYEADGVAISDDGVHWHPVWNNTASDNWQKFTIDLAAEATAHGISLNSDFRIKFQQYDNYAMTTDGAGFDQIEITMSAIPGEDWYQFTLDGDETSTLALADAVVGMTLELYDSAGTLLTSGSSAGNFASVISNFTAPSSNTYYARVAGYGQDYKLLVTKNADLDMGLNHSMETAQLLPALAGQSSVALGYLEVGGSGGGSGTILLGSPFTTQDDSTGDTSSAIATDSDYYKISANVGQPLVIATDTPAGGPGEFVNDLDPVIELYDPTGTLVASDDNSDPDGRNARLAHIATMDGEYTVRVFSASDDSDGEYVLLVNASQVALTMPSDAWEDGGPVTATVDISLPSDSDLVVNLTSGNPARVGVPSTVIIPAGQISQTITLDIMDDSLLQGPEDIAIMTSAEGHGTSTALIHLYDDETAILTVDLPMEASEDAGVLVEAGTIIVDTASVYDVTIELLSSDESEISVPPSVVLPAGQTSVTFDITVNDDTLIDDTQTVSVTASVENWTTGQRNMDVLDNDRTLEVTLPAAVWEGQGLMTEVGMVEIGGTLPSDLVVSLVSDDTSELDVPVTVIIPAGQTTATFDATIIDDSDTDALQTVTIAASVPGFMGDETCSVAVHDNELDYFEFSAISDPQTASVAFVAEVYAKNVDGETILVYGEIVTLTGTSDSSSVPVTPDSCTFTDGVWTGDIAVDAVASDVILTVDNGAGQTVQSNAFDVIPGPMVGLQLSTISSPQYVNTPFNLTVTAVDANGHTATGYNATVDIGGLVNTGTSSSIVISEIEVGATDRMEFTNVSGEDLDIGGWTVWGYDSAYPETPQALLTIPDGTVCPAGGVFVLEEFGTTPGAFPHFYSGTNLNWTPISQTGVLLLDRIGSVMDFVAASSLDPATVSTPLTMVPQYWQGDQVVAVDSEVWSYQRVGNTDHNDASDWVVNQTPSVGSLNSGLDTSFTGGVVAVEPTTFTLVDGVCTESVIVLQAADDMFLRVDDGVGHVFDSNTFDVLPPALMVFLPTDVTEGSGTIAAVSVSTLQDTDLVIHIESSDPSRLNVPSEIILPAGQSTVMVPVQVVDNSLLDGPQDITLTATATDYVAGTAMIHFHDNETAELTVSLPGSGTEGDGVLVGAGVITASAAPSQDIVVYLSSDNTHEVDVPTSVILPAGQTEVAFDLTILDDTLIDDTQMATITATVENWTNGMATMDALDNDRTLAVTLPTDAWESESFGDCTVEIGGTLSTDLVVSLLADDTSELDVPATVTIPAGQTMATFTATMVTDSDRDGLQTTNLTATVSGFSDAAAPIVVHDGDVDHFEWNVIDGPQRDTVSFSTTARAINVDGEVIIVYDTLASLSATGDSGATPVTPIDCAFSSGVWTGDVIIDTVDTNVTLTLNDGSGTGTSNAFEVVPGPVASFQWSTIASPQYANAPISVVLTAYDANGYAATNFDGTVDLSGWMGEASPAVGMPSTSETLGDVSLLGTDLQLGINADGSLILGNKTLGAKFFNHEFLTPGSPVAAFLLAVNGSVYENNAPEGSPSIPMDVYNVSSGEYLAAQAEGTQNGISIDRLISFRPEDHVVTFQVTLQNTSDAVRNNIAWMEKYDPDQGHSIASNYHTENDVLFDYGYVEAVFRHSSYPNGLTIGIGANDARAVASVEAFAATPFDVLNSPYDPNGVSDDMCSCLAFDVGTLAPGESTTLTYYMVFGTDRQATEDLFVAQKETPVSITPTTVTFVDGVWTGDVSVLEECENVYLRVDDGNGHLAESNMFEVTPLTLDLVVPTTDAGETTGTINATVSLPVALSGDLVVDLTSSNPGRVGVPTSVTIPAGQTFVSVPLTVVDNALLDGVETITITVTAPNSVTDSSNLTIHDDETAVLTVSLPSDATEGDGLLSGMGTITSSEAPTRDIVVQLTSNDDGEVAVPATVVLPAGQTTVAFDLTILDDTLIDDLQTVTITATAENWTDGVATMNVLDNDRTLAVTLPTDAWEGKGTTANAGMVEIGGTLPTDLVISLNSDDETELQLPATVTILAGETMAMFDVTIVDDPDSDGQQAAAITASNAEFSEATTLIVVYDNELDHFVWDTIAGLQTASEPFAVTVHAQNVDNEDIMYYDDTAALTATGDSGSLSATPSSATFSNGVYSGNVTVDAVDTNVVLTVNDGAGQVANSNTFNLVAGPMAGFQWSTVASAQYVNVPFPVTLTAVDAHGYTVTDFNDTVDLSGLTGDGAISHTIFDNPVSDDSNVYYTDYTLGYSFTPDTDILVTHFRHYFGNKVSLWTNSGTLLASEVYSDAAGTWIETPLTTPVQLDANTTYRIGSHFAANEEYHWRTDMSNAFPDGTINESYEEPGDAFPDDADSVRWWFVGMRYDVGSGSSVATAPTSVTFLDGTWTGDVTVLETANDMYLKLNYGSGLTSESNTFDVLATPIDFGDAPASYSTLSADNGAGHMVVSGYHLGSAVDAEVDGQPGIDALLDDVTGTPDDEDGVVFSGPLYLGMDTTIDVTASAVGQLDAWIDFNDDGDWDDAGEKIFDNVSLTAGTNTLTITVPATATLTYETFSRFRFSSTGGLSYTGIASDGEVEDYLVSIQLAPPTLDAEPATTSGTENTVSWSAVPGAEAYYVQCDNNADFSSPETNSGWITATTHTFVGLTTGETYYYRVKSRQESPGGTDFWTQTTQADFDADVLDNTDITSQPGDVVLTGSASTGDGDVLWDLTHGPYSGYEPSGVFSDLTSMLTDLGYSVTTTDVGLNNIDLSSFEVIVINLASNHYTQYTSSEVAAIESFVQNGGGLLIHGDAPDTPNANVNPVAQVFGSTFGISVVSDEVLDFEPHEICTGITHIVLPYPGSINVVSPSTVVAYSDGAAVVSVAEVGIGRVVMIGDIGIWANVFMDDYDNTQFAENVFGWLSESTDYSPSGNIVSEPITPAEWQSWGILDFNNTMPTDTTLTVDVLPATGTTPIPGYENVASGTDLSGITETTIRLRANLATTDSAITPALHDWTVDWQEPNVYVESSWSNTVSSTQIEFLRIPGDANLDGIVNGSDATILSNNWQKTGVGWAGADFNDDGIVNSSDATILSMHWQETAATYTNGDLNGDGIVNGSDATLLANNWQKTEVGYTGGDLNGDGIVNGSDATLLANCWQEASDTYLGEDALVEALTATSDPAEDASESLESLAVSTSFSQPSPKRALAGPQHESNALPKRHFTELPALQSRPSANDDAAIHDAALFEEYGQDAEQQATLDSQTPAWAYYAARQDEMGPKAKAKHHRTAHLRAIDLLLMDPEL